MMEMVVLLVGLGLNVIVTVGGFIGVVMKIEHRLTAVETKLLYVMPKRSTDKASL